MGTLGEAPKIAVGDVLDGKYKITGILGSGAMGVVYEAIHTRLKRTVALKTLRAEYTTHSRLIDRFEREARASSAIGHPNIVQIFDAGGENAAVPYLAMERLKGQNLGDILREEKLLETPRAVDVCCQLLEGLAAAHAAGILHRDIKPDNIFITQDQDGNDLVKILDFGISKILDLTDSEHGEQVGGDITQKGVVVGTPNYMSPEQVCADPDVDLRADLWSVVCVLYKCLSGRTPFGGETRQQLMAATLQGDFVPLQKRCPDLPLALGAIIRRGLMPEIADRYQNARALLEALKQVHNGSHPDTLRVLTGVSETLRGMPGDNSDTIADSPDSPDSPDLPDLPDLPELPPASPGPEVVAEDAAMLTAFDNVADRLQSQDAILAPAADAPPAEKKEPAPTKAKQRKFPSANPFAPPGSQEEMLLEVDIAPTAGPAPRVRGAPKEPASRAANKPAGARKTDRRPMITREESSSVGPLLLKLCLIALVVAAAGGTYRYTTKGYVFSADVPRMASLSLKISTDGAQVFINETREFESELSLVAQEEHSVRVAAKDRVGIMTTIEAEGGAAYKIAVNLSHPMFKLNSQFVAAPIDVTSESDVADKAPMASSIDAARDKLHAFGSCGLRLFIAIAELPKDASRPSRLWVLDRGLTDECGATLDIASKMKPSLPSVDDSTRSLRMSITDFNKAVVAFQKSTGAQRSIVKERERTLGAALTGLKARSQDFKNAMSQEQSRWLDLEVLRVDALAGDALHSQLRNLAVSSDAWMRGTLSGANSQKARKGMTDYYSFLTAAQEKRKEEFDARGVTGYLHALKPLMGNGQDEHTVSLHNYAVDVFNKILLPINVDVERAEL